jgi:hypothetical protein
MVGGPIGPCMVEAQGCIQNVKLGWSSTFGASTNHTMWLMGQNKGNINTSKESYKISQLWSPHQKKVRNR